MSGSLSPVSKSSAQSGSSLALEPLYGEIQEIGTRLRQWIQDPETPNCPIDKTTLTLSDISNMPLIAPQLEPKAENLGFNLRQQVIELGLPYEYGENPETSQYRLFNIRCQAFQWDGHTGPGMILLDEVHRHSDRTPACPYISQISQVLYEKDFALEDLKHIFVTTIVNESTNEFITRQLYYHQEGDTASWPPHEPESWEIGTPEYDALLGTKIGKLVAYFVLGAFERGTKQISRIVVWSDWFASPNLRFDIEDVSRG